MNQPHQVLPPTAPVPAPDDVLEQLVRAGARKMLQDALEAEVDEFLGRRRYERTDEKRGYRNGHQPARTIGVGMGAVEVRLPRVSEVPPEVSPKGFESGIVVRYQRRSRTQERLLHACTWKVWPVVTLSRSFALWWVRPRHCRRAAS